MNPPLRQNEGDYDMDFTKACKKDAHQLALSLFDGAGHTEALSQTLD
jgi:hypothetical protein